MRKSKPQDSAFSDTSNDDLENVGFFAEFLEFIRHNKKWWLIPLLVVLMLVGGLLILAGHNAAIAPFIYTFF